MDHPILAHVALGYSPIIDRDRAVRQHPGGEVFFVKIDCHMRTPLGALGMEGKACWRGGAAHGIARRYE